MFGVGVWWRWFWEGGIELGLVFVLGSVLKCSVRGFFSSIISVSIGSGFVLSLSVTVVDPLSICMNLYHLGIVQKECSYAHVESGLKRFSH